MGTPQWQILNRLPELRSDIVDRLAGDAKFQSICRDYDRCAEAVKTLRDSAQAVPDHIAEYERLLTELEDEIRHALNDD